jgi:DNA modification methylase
MKKVSIGLLRPNKISLSIYGNDLHCGDFLTLKKSIELEGILEPLVITEDYFIISGVRRFYAAQELGIQEVPVVISTVKELEIDEYMIISHQQHRVKTEVQILREIEIITSKYNLKQGRKSSDPEVIKGKMEREKLINLKSKSTIDRLREAKNNLVDLYHGDEERAWEELSKMEKEGKSVNYIKAETEFRLKKHTNSTKMEKVKIPQIEELYKIYEGNSQDLSFLEDNSVDCIFTSPPYYDFRDYQTGHNQIGVERTVDAFIDNLVKVFLECHRVMKPTGSLFINIMDSIKGGVLVNVPGKLKQALMDQGFLFISELIWVKENPAYVRSKRPQPSHEYIFHFSKTLDYNYYTDWMSDHEFEGQIVYGDLGKKRQLRSFFDYRGQIIQTAGANNLTLGNKFKEMGYSLSHSATMPFEVASVGLLSTTQKGDVVLDPFSGLGTTGLAAISQDRYYIGVDNNSEYIELAKLRLNLFAKDMEEYLVNDYEEDFQMAA